jgi:hypothetical protein
MAARMSTHIYTHTQTLSLLHIGGVYGGENEQGCIAGSKASKLEEHDLAYLPEVMQRDLTCSAKTRRRIGAVMSGACMPRPLYRGITPAAGGSACATTNSTPLETLRAIKDSPLGNRGRQGNERGAGNKGYKGAQSSHARAWPPVFSAPATPALCAQEEEEEHQQKHKQSTMPAWHPFQ